MALEFFAFLHKHSEQQTNLLFKRQNIFYLNELNNKTERQISQLDCTYLPGKRLFKSNYLDLY